MCRISEGGVDQSNKNCCRHCSSQCGVLQRTCLFITFIVLFGLVVISINISIPFWFSSSNSASPDEYTLTDTVIVPYTKFCSSLEIESKDSVESKISDSTASLYLLSSPPSLSAHENFTYVHSTFFTMTVDTYSWSLNLHPGSTIDFVSCYAPIRGHNNTPKGVVYYLIQGDENYNNWVDDPNDSYTVQHVELNTHCKHVRYQVYDDDIYYFVFFNMLDVRSSLNIQFKVNRTRYQFSPDSLVDSCAITVNSHSSCYVNLPVFATYTALLELDTTSPAAVDWDDGVTISIECQPRGWLYAVIVVGVILLLLLITCVVLIGCMCTYLKRRGRRKSYTAINSEPTISINTYGRPPSWWYKSTTSSKI